MFSTHKDFQSESGRGSQREVSGTEFFMLVSFLLTKYRASRILTGGGSKFQFWGSVLYVYVLLQDLTEGVFSAD